MNAYLFENPGDADVLKLVQIATPELKAGEILIETKAISINPVDAKTRAGLGLFKRFKEHLPFVLGWDIAGIVAKTTADSKFRVGDRVFGMANFPGIGNAYAEFVAVPENQLAKIPATISFEKAAAATLAALTALQVMRPYVKRGDRVLIQSAAGGVGHFAIQIAKILGADVTAIASTKNVEFVKSLGADHVIDYTKENFEDARDFDFMLDTLSGDYIAKSIKTLKKGGTLVTLPSSGFSDEVKALGAAAGVNVQFHLVESNGEDMDQIAGWLASGDLKAEVSQVFAFDQMPAAHKAIETGRTRGKVVVTINN